jgi:ERF superfamily
MTDTPTLAAALAELQQQLPHITKDSKADIPNRPPHKYAALGSLSHELLPIMAKLGLSFSCKPTVRKGQFGMAYKLRLAGTDEVEKGFWPIPGGQPQAQGSALTYYRRYTLQCLTGAVAEDDDDGQRAGQVPAKPQRTRAKVTGPDHERLRHGTVEPTPDDRPAERSHTPADDMWAGQETAGPPLKPMALATEPGSADDKQIRDISIQLTTLGITDHDKQLARIEGIINGPLDGPHVGDDGSRRTRKNLSRAEAEEVRGELAKAIKAMKLAERAAQRAAGDP